MKKKMKLFVVSDIHGHYTLLKQALAEVGFDENDENHLFVCCGDLFDRGCENRQVYDYVRRLKRKILVRGNHDERLVEVLTEKRANVYDYRNGGEQTLQDFFGPGALDDCGNLRLPRYGKMRANLCKFVGSMLDYYETEHYVFTHGWLPLDRENAIPRLREDWREADAAAWHRARFSEWYLQYTVPTAKLPGKTIVCGHRTTRYASHVDTSRSPVDTSIFFGDGVIAIDAGTIRSGRVNVLVLEEEVSV